MKLFAHDKVLLIMTLIFAILLLTACVPSNKVAILSTPKPTIPIAVTPTATPTATPSPIPTATPIFSEERNMELNQKMQDFLNKEGDFTSEKISSIMIKTTSSLDENEIGLGFANGQIIEGYFFDYFENDKSVFLLMGFDGSDGGRFITLVEIPIYYDETVQNASFSVCKNKENDINSTNQESSGYRDRNSLVTVLNEVRNRVIAIMLNEWICDWSTANKSDFSSSFVDFTINELNPKASLASGLFYLVTSNGFEISNADVSESMSIIEVNCMDDLNNTDFKRVPIILAIIYFESP